MTPSRPIRALIVSTTMHRGGAQRVTSTLLRHFDREVVQPSLCLARDDIGYEIPGDVEVHHLGYRGPHTFFRTARRLRSLIRSSAPDVVLSNVNAMNILTGWALRDRRIETPWVARVGAGLERHDDLFRKTLSPLVYPRASAIVANSQGLAKEAEERFPFAAGKVACISNPTDWEHIDRRATERPHVALPEDRPVIMAVGRLDPEKRADLMIRALAKVAETGPAELWFLGDGPELQSLQSLASSLGVSDRVRWLGFVENPYALLARAAVYVLASDNEGMPNALIEAQGLGIPSVATRCPHGPDEIVDDGVTGWLVPVGDHEALAEAITRVLDGHERDVEAHEHSRRAIRERFSRDTLTLLWQELLGSVAGADA
jgi:N-acetylgalactosamine-N,N'-diacetylbacillosaminyl-diphospho-undecaprenol 4-alpha-N-acetylgalactosaminyltransferase